MERILEYPDATSTRDTLINVGSVLKDEIIKAYMDNCTISSYVKEVLVYNSSLSKSTKDKMLESELPVSSKITILNAQDNRSEGKELRDRLSWKSKEHASHVANYVNLLSIDPTENYSDSELISFLQSDNSVDAKKALLEIYVAKGDLTNSALLSQELSTSQHPDYIALMGTLASVNAQNSLMVALSENNSLYETIETYALSENSEVASLSKSILNGYNWVIEDNDIAPLTGPSSMSIFNNQNTESEYTLNTNIVSVYPNPSTGKVYFDLPNQDEDVMTIELFDLSGKKVTAREFQKTNGELIDFSDVQKGTYMVRITLGTDYTESQLLQLK